MNAVAPAILDKLRKLTALLTSNRDGERAAAMNAIARVLESNGLDWLDLADAIVQMPRRGRTTAHVRPGTVQGDLANLPKALDVLKPLRHWVGWSWEWRVNKGGNGKWTKPLLRPDNPRRYAKSDDPTTWGTYEQALAACKAGLCEGIGFCLLGSNIGAFDLDNCRDPITGAIAPEAMAIVERASSYTEITVSGTGLRVVGIGAGTPLQVQQKLPDCCVEVESYRNCARYITVSGNVLPGAPVAMVDIDSVLEAVVAELGYVQRADVAFDLPPDSTPFSDGTISTSQASIDDAGRLALRAVSPSIVTALLGQHNRRLSNNIEMRWYPRGGFSLCTRGSKAGFWYSHSEKDGGDMINLIMRELKCSFTEALAFAAPFVNGQRPLLRIGTNDEDEGEEEARTEKAMKIWSQSRPLRGTLAEHYLRSRGIEVPAEAREVLRFHTACPFDGRTVPALVALVRDILTDEPIAIHRTALTEDGRKLDRPRVLGSKQGGAIKLSPISSIDSELAIGEGIETTLSARPLGIDIPAWSLCDAAGLSQFPVLPSLAAVERLTILADNDASQVGQNAAAKTRARWKAARRCVRVLTPDEEGSDFNDLLMARGRR